MEPRLYVSTPSQVSTEMGDRFAGVPFQACNQLPRLTQPPRLSGMGKEYRPKCGDALRLGVKAGMAHLIQLWIKRVHGWHMEL